MRRQRRTLTLLGGALAVALACLAGAPSLHQRRRGERVPGKPPARAHAKPTPPAEVTLTPALGAGAAVTMAPVGLSLEYPVMAADLGSGPCPPAALIAELLRLGSPPLALAGASQDQTAPSGSAAARHPPPGKRRRSTRCPPPSGASCTAC